MLAAVANAALLLLYAVVGLQMVRAFISHRRRLRQKAKQLVLELTYTAVKRADQPLRSDHDRDWDRDLAA